MNKEGDSRIRSSRVDVDGAFDTSYATLVAAILALGLYTPVLRALHWSVAITVLGSTIIMAAIRAYVRRGLGARPDVFQLLEGHEVSWLASKPFNITLWEISTMIPAVLSPANPASEPYTLETNRVPLLPENLVTRKVVEVHKEISELVSWPDDFTVVARQTIFRERATAGSSPIAEENNGSNHNEPPLILLEVKKNMKPDIPVGRTSCEEEEALAPSVGITKETSTGKTAASQILSDEKRSENDDIAEINENRAHDFRQKNTDDYIDNKVGNKSSLPSSTLDPYLIGIQGGMRPQVRAYSSRDWWLEDPNAIEKAIQHSNLYTTLGFSTHVLFRDGVFRPFGYGFQWECVIEHIHGDGARFSKSVFYFRLHGTEKVPNQLASTEGDDKKLFGLSWSADVDALAAVISLSAAGRSSRISQRASERRTFIRLLGSGWESQVSACIPGPGDPWKQRKTEGHVVGRWIPQDTSVGAFERGSSSDRPFGNVQSRTSSTQQVVGSAGAEAWQRRSLDLYSTWIERKTVSHNIPGIISKSEEIERLIDSMDPAMRPVLNPTHKPYFGLEDLMFGNGAYFENLRVYRPSEPISCAPSMALRQDSSYPGRVSHSRLGSRGSIEEMSAKDNHAQASHNTLKEAKIVFSTTSLTRVTGQEIFTEFMLQVATHITKVGGKTTRRAPLRGDGIHDYRLQNTELSKLADIVLDSGLAEDEEEAYILIIPAFRARGLLPMQLSDEDDDKTSEE
ncbi:hypothetical protein AJ79_07695 [Helicocarpus griseus UAMH5409]|uniref:Uncharacterized protein n=1 Tax=Helicocarpus griseus UAMH5409 TaxID=1447875 RepID=A0A2B7WZK2_9EURO|nr:hypothetical protein AJ79_07695 [Helicocarpus griseus UAMH5409]